MNRESNQGKQGKRKDWRTKYNENNNCTRNEKRINKKLTSVLRPRLRGAGILAIEAEIIAKRIVRLEIGILESPRYRISIRYLLAFFRRNSPLAIAATCATKNQPEHVSILVEWTTTTFNDRSRSIATYLGSAFKFHGTE